MDGLWPDPYVNETFMVGWTIKNPWNSAPGLNPHHPFPWSTVWILTANLILSTLWNGQVNAETVRWYARLRWWGHPDHIIAYRNNTKAKESNLYSTIQLELKSSLVRIKDNIDLLITSNFDYRDDNCVLNIWQYVDWEILAWWVVHHGTNWKQLLNYFCKTVGFPYRGTNWIGYDPNRLINKEDSFN
jgi:hypothetical protein